MNTYSDMPDWLVELSTVLLESFGRRAAEAFDAALSSAVLDAAARGVEWPDIFAAIRLDSVLPIALDAIGTGDEPWRVECRLIVQECIDSGGSKAEPWRVESAAWTAWLVGMSVEEAAAYAGPRAEEAAAFAAEGDHAAGAGYAAESAGVLSSSARAAAYARIAESTLRIIGEAKTNNPGTVLTNASEGCRTRRLTRR